MLKDNQFLKVQSWHGGIWFSLVELLPGDVIEIKAEKCILAEKIDNSENFALDFEFMLRLLQMTAASRM